MDNIVVTGMGVVSAYGVGVDAFYEGLAQGHSAIRRIGSFDVSCFPVTVAGEVLAAPVDHDWLMSRLGFIDAAGNDLLEHYRTVGAWRDRKTAFALLAAQEAWRMAAGADVASRTPAARRGLVLALGLEQAWLEDFAPLVKHGHIDWQQQARAPTSLCFRSDVDLAAQLVARRFDLQGELQVNVSACAAGGLAIAQAASLLARGAADVILCGGADSMVNPLGMGGMARLGAPSPRPTETACRPFDRHRDGLVIGEGAAMFVLETEARAMSRGARPLARIRGYGSSQDGWRTTAPRPDGAAAQRAMQLALDRAGLSATDLGYINAHGTGTPLNDIAEARAIRALCGDHADVLPVSSIKGAIGHLMAASGAIELAACVFALQRDTLPATTNLQTLDQDCAINVIGAAPEAACVEHILSNSFGFGGQNVSLIVSRC